jgi:hypothetical protein
MDHHAGSQAYLYMYNDLVSLPIIITDWDVVVENQRHASTSSSADIDTTPSPSRTETSSASPSSQRWSTGFTAYTDDLWKRMSVGMKQKLREACVEVLKRTDDVSDAMKEHGDNMSWQYDDDARFLD